jgi:spore coat protein CotH
MRHGRLVTIALVAAAWLLMPETTYVQALTADDLFNDQTLHEIRISIHSKDLALLREFYFLNKEYPADLTWREQGRELRVRNVAIRSRGLGSRNREKLGLEIDIDKYTTGQRFLGMHRLVLDNLWQDPSMIRESLAMAIFSKAGQPAPRESFCRLFINNRYEGLYAIVEAVDDVFVSRVLNQTGGYLYEYHYKMPFFMTDLGDDYESWKPLFEPRTHELEDDNSLYLPIRELFREINAPDDAVWAERVNARIDIAQFMTHVAIQAFLGENDGILGFAGINNLYLYRPADSTRHRLFAWDEDNAFVFPGALLRKSDLAPIVLYERAFERAEFRTVYLDVAERCARFSAEDNWLLNEIERRATLITDAVLEDTNKQFKDNDLFFKALDELRAFAATQPAHVLQEVQRLR